MSEILSKRIGNLEFKVASYLTRNIPSYPAYLINYYYPNRYYGRENEFIKEGDWYLYKDSPFCKVHKNCFEKEQSCMAIASFDYNNDNYYDLSFVSDRPLSLNDEEWKIFKELLEYGFKQLNYNE